MTRDGKKASDIKQAVAANVATNELLHQKLSIPAAEEAGTQVIEQAAVFSDCLKTELEAWDSFQTTKAAVSSELGEWRTNSDDAYRMAAAEASEEPPAAFLSIIEGVRRLAPTRLILTRVRPSVTARPLLWSGAGYRLRVSKDPWAAELPRNAS